MIGTTETGESHRRIATRHEWRTHVAHQGSLRQAIAELLVIFIFSSVLVPMVVLATARASSEVSIVDAIIFSASSDARALLTLVSILLAIASPFMLAGAWVLRRCFIDLMRINHHSRRSMRFIRHEIRRGIRVERSILPSTSDAFAALMQVTMMPCVAIFVAVSMEISLFSSDAPTLLRVPIALIVVVAAASATMALLQVRESPFETTIALRRFCESWKPVGVAVPQRFTCSFCMLNLKPRPLFRRWVKNIREFYAEYLQYSESRLAVNLRAAHKNPLIITLILIGLGAIVFCGIADLSARAIAIFVTSGLGIGLLYRSFGRNLGEMLFPQMTWTSLARTFGCLGAALALLLNLRLVTWLTDVISQIGVMANEDSFVVFVLGLEAVGFLVGILILFPGVDQNIDFDLPVKIIRKSLWLLLPFLASAFLENISVAVVSLVIPLAVNLLAAERGKMRNGSRVDTY